MISAHVATTTTTDVWARSIGVRYTKAIARKPHVQSASSICTPRLAKWSSARPVTVIVSVARQNSAGRADDPRDDARRVATPAGEREGERAGGGHAAHPSG